MVLKVHIHIQLSIFFDALIFLQTLKLPIVFFLSVHEYKCAFGCQPVANPF